MSSENNQVCLFQDYAVKSKQTFFFGQVLRMTYATSAFRRPVLLDDPRKHDIKVSLQKFKHHQSGLYARGDEIIEAKLSDILCDVHLELQDDTELLKLIDPPLSQLEEVVIERMPRRRQRQQVPGQLTVSRDMPGPSYEGSAVDTGRITRRIGPEHPEDPNIRRSLRTRTRVDFEYK